MAQTTHNAPQVLKSSRQLHNQLQGLTVQAVDAGADELQAAIRSGIPKSAGGRVGNFPGYAARGALWSDVSRTPARRAGTIVTASVYMAPGKSKAYQKIHEYGGIIRAKPGNRAGGYLVFRVMGRWVKVRQVRIRQKNYFSGQKVKSARSRIESAMARVLRKLR